MKKIITIITVIMLVLIISGCNIKEEKELSGIKVVTTIFPYYDFVRQLSDDNIEVKMLIKPGVDMHSYDPTAEDIMNILSADIFIYTGGHSDAWLANIMDEIDLEKTKIIRVFDHLDVVKEDDILGATTDHDHHHHHHDEDVEYDEHVWTSIPNAKTILGVIKDSVVDYREKREEDYSIIVFNYNDYINKMNELDEEIRGIVSNASTNYLLFGDRFAFRYFTDEYNLTYSAAFTGCSTVTEPSAQTMTFLTRKIKEKKVPAILYLEGSSKKVAQTLAEETGVKILEFNSMQNITKKDFDSNETYISIMRRNIEVLRETL